MLALQGFQMVDWPDWSATLSIAFAGLMTEPGG
jgi:hypothetical protein